MFRLHHQSVIKSLKYMFLYRISKNAKNFDINKNFEFCYSLKNTYDDFSMSRWNFYVMPFLNNKSLWWMTCSLRVGFHLAMIRPSNIFRFLRNGDALVRVLHSNSWIGDCTFSFVFPFSIRKCLDGSEVPVGLSCSSNRTSWHLFVSQM